MNNETENKILRCEYEKLLFERDRVKKEADNYLRLYIHEFGELLTELFRKKISCIEKKKMIGYCQTAVNYGKLIDIEEMNRHIEREMSYASSVTFWASWLRCTYSAMVPSNSPDSTSLR